MARYEPPEWGVHGRNVFGIYLEVIKSGVVMEKLALPITSDSSCVVAGRMEPQCDLVLAHPSISRVHGALQFDEQGALFLCDLCSTHGCYVNKKRVKAEEFERLHIGDVLCFGESTRLYAVCGPAELLPAEYESLNLAKFREKLEKKKELREKKKQEEERGASWGFGEDAEEESDDDDDEEEQDQGKEQLPDYLRNLKEEDQPYKSSVSKTEVSEKDQRVYQQLQTRIRKMENLKLEKSRILAKQHQLDGLTEGQQRTLDRNEQRIDALMKEINDLEGRIHAKNDQRSKTSGTSGTLAKRRNVNEELYGYSSDEDDFYDRTKANQQKMTARKQRVTGMSSNPASTEPVKTSKAPKKTEVVTVDSIQAHIEKLEHQLVEIENELKVASTKAGEARYQDSKQEEEVDSLDSFMAATTSQLHVNTVETIAKRKLEVEIELKRQRQLLVVATPALASLPVQSSVSKEETKSPNQAALPDPASSEVIPFVPKKEQPPAAGKFAKKEQARVDKSSVEKEIPDNTARPASSRASEAASKRTESEASAKKRRRIAGPERGSLVTTKLKTNTLPDEQDKVADTGILEGGDQVWVPPKNQTGDGRTSLNDKFGY